MDSSKNYLKKQDILLDNLNKNFKLPIEFNIKKKEILKNLKYDLELTMSKNNKNNYFYKNFFKPNNEIGNNLIKKWSKYYTSDIIFLKDSQKLYKNNFNIDKKLNEEMWDLWKSIKLDDSFFYKYQYISWEKFNFLNESSFFLFFFGIYCILSPLLNILTPFIIMIIPFFILKIMRVPITSETYIEILKKQLNKQIFGRLFTDFNSLNTKEKLYSFVGFGMYIYNIYQNFLSFYYFNKNIELISKFFSNLHKFLDNLNKNLTILLDITSNYESFINYNSYLKKKQENLKKLKKEILEIKKIKKNFKCLKNMGIILKYFYLINKNKNLESDLLFGFGFNEFLNNINSINNHIINKELKKCKFIKKKNNIIKFKKCYIPFLETEENVVKNDINFKNNVIITGPNASGKTTLIKVTLLNVLLSQQIGYGFYSSGSLTPYDYLHCYINIPDTSSRDSLFQAEARRCKNILDSINKNKSAKHLCIFDELFSGTNPEEAVASAYAYLNYISNNSNIKFLLTTHFLKICKLFQKNDSITNYKMNININENNDMEYNYKIIKGISKIKGGINILKKLNFSPLIIDQTKKIIKTL